jgi:hypothetical protein
VLDPLEFHEDETSQLAWELVGLRQQIDMLEMKFSELAAALAATDYWDRQGSNSALDWLRFNCHLTDRAAGDRIAVGQTLAEMPESIQALQHGEIGFAHVATMARTAKALGEGFDEVHLLGLARKHSPGKFYFKSLHYRHAVDARGYAREQASLVENRHLSLATAEDGCLLINGVLDPVGGAAVRSSLEALAKPGGKDDHRIREQRLADALLELTTRSRNVQMQVTASVETLLGLAGAPGAANEFSLPISSATVERWACDCAISRVLLQDSVVIDVGRSVRTTTGPRKRALVARDQNCRWPGCERPASWCESHHIEHWLHGGGSEIENQVLLCTRHHWKVHEGGWQLVKTEGGGIVPIAPTVTFGLPRGPD